MRVAFAAAVFLMAGAAQAEPFAKKGSMVAFGEISYSSSSGEQKQGANKQDLADETQLDLTPLFGYFVIDGLMLGGGLAGTRSTSEDDNNESTSSLISLAVKPAYYHRMSDLLLLTAGIPLNYLISGEITQTANNNKNTTDVSGWSAGIEGGVAIALGAERGGLFQATLGYEKRSLTAEPDGAADVDIDQGEFKLNLGLGVFF